MSFRRTARGPAHAFAFAALLHLVPGLLAPACSSSSGTLGSVNDAAGRPDGGDAATGPKPDAGDAGARDDATVAHDAAGADATHDGASAIDGMAALDAMKDAPGDTLTIDAPRVDAKNDGAKDAASDVANTSDAADASDAPPPDPGYDAGPPALAYRGRVDYGDPAGPRFDWSGVEVVGNFTGTAINLEMADYGNYFDVFVDGVQYATILGDNATTDYPLASGLAPGPHSFVVHRRTEAVVSITQILGVTFPEGGGLLPPPKPPSRRIEVIGDSISCAFGVLGDGPSCTGTNDLEEHYDSYEAIAGRAFDADVHTIAWSGKGVYDNYGDTGGSASGTLPDLYGYAIPTATPPTSWDFTSWIPDVVVIELGTNDFWQDDPGPAFTSAYVAFVQQVRGYYKDAFILLATSPLLLEPDYDTQEADLQAVIAAINSNGNVDPRIAIVPFATQGAANGYGCDYHPSVATHAAMAQVLETSIHSAVGW
jgi:lysophospholipase L1-like esterase